MVEVRKDCNVWYIIIMVKDVTGYLPKIRQYVVAGRKLPSEKDPEPTIYRMRIFATNEVSAKSNFWYYIKKMCKVKRAAGEILAVEEVKEKKTNYAKTYGLLIRYDNIHGVQNMYREYRETSLCGAVGRMYQDMAGRHRAEPNLLHIVHASIIKNAEKVKRKYTVQFYNSKIAFPLLHAKVRPPSRDLRRTFVASRPTTASH